MEKQQNENQPQKNKSSKQKKKTSASNPPSLLRQLKDFQQKKEYEKAALLYSKNIEEGTDTIESANIMLEIYAKLLDHNKVQSLFKRHVDKKRLNLDSYRTMIDIVLNNPGCYDSIASTLQQFKDCITGMDTYLAEAVYFYHSYIEYLCSRNSAENKNEIDILKFERDKLCQRLDKYAQENSNDLTLGAAWLLNHYYPDKYKKQLSPEKDLSLDKIMKFNQEVFKKLDKEPSLDVTPKEDSQVHVINHKGVLIKTEKKPSAIFDILTDKRFGNYVIVEFSDPVKPIEIPLVISYQGEEYWTDTIGGPGRRHDHKNDRCKKLIAIRKDARSWAALGCFSERPELAYYGQRCLMPKNHVNPGMQLTGKFHIALVSDGFNIGSHVVSDGFGLIKASLAEKLKIDWSVHSTKQSSQSSSYLNFQGLHTIPVDKNPKLLDMHQKKGGKVTNDLTLFIENVNQTIKKPLSEVSSEKHPFDGKIPSSDEFFYSTSTGGIKNTSYTIIPTLGNNILLSPGEYKKGDEEEVIVGKSPYSTNSLHTAKVVFDEELSKEKIFQYTLAGYSQEGAFHGSSGQLLIVPDEEWDNLLKNNKLKPEYDCIIPKTDRKLKPSQKLAKQAESVSEVIESVELHGVLVAIKTPAHPLMKVPFTMAKADGNDFDGDVYDVMYAKDYPELYAYLKGKPASLFPNEKFEKTYTQTGIGTLIDKFLDLQRDLVVPATQILNAIYQLTEEERKELAQHIHFDETHCLDKLLPNVGNVGNNDSNLLLEIQQFNQRAYCADKTHGNQEFYWRLQVYLAAIYKLFPKKLVNPYAGRYQKKFNALYSELLQIGLKLIKLTSTTSHRVDTQVDIQSVKSRLITKWDDLLIQFQNLIQPITETSFSPNIVGRNQQLSLAKLHTFFKEPISNSTETFEQHSKPESRGAIV